MTLFDAAHRRAIFAFVAIFTLLGLFAAPSWAAGAFALGKCGAYGQAYDYPAVAAARAAPRR